MSNVNMFIRGSVWWYERDLDEQGITHGQHPCVIVSDNEWNENSRNVIIVPCTTSLLKGCMKGTQLELKDTTGNIFVTQITVVPKRNLHSFKGLLHSKDMALLEEAMRALLGLGCLNDHKLSDLIEASFVESTANPVADEVNRETRKEVKSRPSRERITRRKPTNYSNSGIHYPITCTIQKKSRTPHARYESWTREDKEALVRMANNGATIKECSEAFDIKPSSAERYIRLFRKELGLAD